MPVVTVKPLNHRIGADVSAVDLAQPFSDDAFSARCGAPGRNPGYSAGGAAHA